MNKCIKNKKMYTSEYSVFLSVRRLFTCIGRCHTEDGKLARLAICVGNHPLSKATAHFLILTSLNANDDIKSALITCLHYLSTRPMSRAADAILVDHVRRRPNSATTFKQDNYRVIAGLVVCRIYSLMRQFILCVTHIYYS